MPSRLLKLRAQKCNYHCEFLQRSMMEVLMVSVFLGFRSFANTLDVRIGRAKFGLEVHGMMPVTPRRRIQQSSELEFEHPAGQLADL